MTTIVLPVSRDSFLKAVFERLELLECDPLLTNIFVYVDGDLQLFEIAQRYLSASKFKDKQIKYRRRGLPNVGHVLSRRRRIAEIHNEIKELIPQSNYVFLIEDDTLFDAAALSRLLQVYYNYPAAGFISGVQIGRWGFSHIGAWRMRPGKIFSLPYEPNIIAEVDAAGLYCCLTKYETYRKHNFQPYGKILGPDFNFGITLKAQGLKNYADFSVTCEHLTKRGSIRFDNTDIIQVGFVMENDEWLLTPQL